MAKLKTRGVVIDTVQLKRSMQDVANAAREAAADLAAESLQAMVDAINAKTSNRSTAILGSRVGDGTRDKPLEEAKVVKLIKRDVHDSRNHRVVVYVEHQSLDGANLFNVLDSGRKAKPVKTSFVMPAYRGHVTHPNMKELDAGNPKTAKFAFGPSAQIITYDKGKRVGKPVLIFMAAGTSLGSIEARNFYEAAAEWVESELVNREIVDKSRRLRTKLKKGDVIISVPDRPRFTGI